MANKSLSQKLDAYQRMRQAGEDYPEAILWCRANNLRLIIFNGGHHWRVAGPKPRKVRQDYILNWWPSSGLVTWANARREHASRWDKVRSLLEGCLQDVQPSPPPRKVRVPNKLAQRLSRLEGLVETLCDDMEETLDRLDALSRNQQKWHK